MPAAPAAGHAVRSAPAQDLRGPVRRVGSRSAADTGVRDPVGWSLWGRGS